MWEQPYTQTGLIDDTPSFTIKDLNELISDAMESPFIENEEEKQLLQNELRKLKLVDSAYK